MVWDAKGGVSRESGESRGGVAWCHSVDLLPRFICFISFLNLVI